MASAKLTGWLSTRSRRGAGSCAGLRRELRAEPRTGLEGDQAAVREFDRGTSHGVVDLAGRIRPNGEGAEAAPLETASADQIVEQELERDVEDLPDRRRGEVELLGDSGCELAADHEFFGRLASQAWILRTSWPSCSVLMRSRAAKTVAGSAS